MMKIYKRLLPCALALFLLLSLCGCGKTASSTEKTEAPTAEPTTLHATEPATTPATETAGDELVMPDDVPTDADGNPYYLWRSYFYRLKQGTDDPFYCGDAVLTRLITGESSLSFSPSAMALSDTDMLDWANARTDDEGLFEDASLSLKVTGAQTDEYILFHDGKDANYVYLSAQELYVPIVNGSDRYMDGPDWVEQCPKDRTSEDIAAEFSLKLRNKWDEWLVVDPAHRIYAATPEEAAEKYCEYFETHMMQIQDSLLGSNWHFEYVRVENLNNVKYDEETKTVSFEFDYTRKAAIPESDIRAGGGIVENEDGSWTQVFVHSLTLAEDGTWVLPAEDNNWK